jgi:V/A-type H+-transporting ATPase subunit F
VKYFVIGDDDARLGFSMVGVEGREVRNASQAEAAFQDALADNEIGIIIMTERAADLIRDLVNRTLFSGRFPLVVEIPDRRGPIEGRPTVREMVNQAIGIKI